LTKESPINAFNGLDSLKWIRFDELKNIDNLTEYKFRSAKWMINDKTQHKRGIKVVLISLNYSHENILSTIKKIYLECHDQLSIHDILGITQDPQDEWNDQIQQWKRKGKMKVALKLLHNSYAKFDEFLQEQLIIRCWDSLPANRPNADELFTTIYNWWKKKDDKDSELYKQIQKSKDFPKKNPRVFSSHRITSRRYSTAYYTNHPFNISTFPKHLSSDFNIRSISIPNQNLLESRNSYFIIINPINSANPNNPDI
ncbi:7613_t:CDS:2, partial [Gigaspora rosea]